MTYKKTWISCLLWAVFTCITGVLLADYTIAIWIQETDIAVGAGTVGMIVLVFALAAGCCLLFRRLYQKAGKKQKTDARRRNLFENLLFSAIFAAALLYRIGLCRHYSLDLPAGGKYFELAAVTAGKTSADVIRSMSELYTVCLSFALSFLGNKPIAGIWMQIFLQMLTICLSFWTLRRLTGKIPAYAAMLFLAFAPVYTGQIADMTPETLSFLLFLLALFIIGNYVKKYADGLYDAHSLIVMSLICGCIIGVLTYLEGLFLALLIIPAGLVGVICTKDGENETPAKILPLFLFVFIVSTAGLALMGLFAYEAYVLEETMKTVAEAWITSHIYPLCPPVYMPYVTKTSVMECFLLIFPAAFLILSFWFRRGAENVSPWIAFMLLFGPPHIVNEASGYRIYSFFIWSVLAGIGLGQCFISKKETVLPIADNILLPETEAESMEGPITGSITKPQTAEPSEASEIPVSGTPEIPAKPRFIENPLPLPKKHEKRTMDYPYAVDETKMNFDIEIAENDDFDV